MKTKAAKIVAFVLVLVLVLSISAPAFAATYNLSVPGITQNNSNWCWAAVGASICQHFGKNRTQNQFCSDCLIFEVNVPVAAAVMKVGFSYNSINNNVELRSLSFAEVKTEIYNGRPIAVLWTWYNGGGHWVALDGFDTSDYVYYMNPSNGRQTSRTYNSFLDNSSSYWRHSVYQLYRK